MTNILDEHAPRCKMRVRERDVPYMTTAWKRAIRTKRRAAQNYEKCKTTENLELKRKLRNEATKQRRKAIKDYWLKKSEALKANPKDFYKTFMPFLGQYKTAGSMRGNTPQGSWKFNKNAGLGI